MPTNNSYITANPATAESGKFTQIDNDTRFPAISVLSVKYFDSSAAFPGNSARPSLSSTAVYPKFAVLTYNTNAIGTDGYDYLASSVTLSGNNWGALQAITSTVIAGITAAYCTTDNLAGVTIPAGTTIYPFFQAIKLTSGSAIAYRTQ